MSMHLSRFCGTLLYSNDFSNELTFYTQAFTNMFLNQIIEKKTSGVLYKMVYIISIFCFSKRQLRTLALPLPSAWPHTVVYTIHFCALHSVDYR